jgi:hypothetical protein
MLRCFIVILFWLCTLGIFSIKIKWNDGLSIKLVGWPDALINLFKNKQI